MRASPSGWRIAWACALAFACVRPPVVEPPAQTRLVAVQLTPASPRLAHGTQLQLSATGTWSDGTQSDVTALAQWSSGDAAVVGLGTAGLVLGRSPGTAQISATLEGVTGATEVTVTAAALVLLGVTPPSPALARGTSLALFATGTFSDGTTQDLTAQVQWESADAAVATVSNAARVRGLATGLSPGRVQVSASLGGVSGATELTVTAARLRTLEVTPAALALARGTSQRLRAIGTFSDGSTQDVTAQAGWVSSAPAVAQVSTTLGSEGEVLAAQPGAAQIRATLDGVVGEAALTVTAARLVRLELLPAAPTLPRGLSVQLTATGHYTDASTQDLTAQVAWSSSAPAVAPVSGAPGSPGLVSGLELGPATITAALGPLSASTQVTVTSAALTALALTPATSTLPAGFDLQFTATGTFSDTSTRDVTDLVTWSTSDAAVAEVSNALSSRGLLSAMGLGACLVIATVGAVTASVPLTVTSAVLLSLTVSAAVGSVARGLSAQFSAQGGYSDGSTQDLTEQVTWSSTEPTVVAVSNAAGTRGRATGLALGTALVRAQLGTDSGDAALEVTPAELRALMVSGAGAPLPRGQSRQLGATGAYTDGSEQDVTQSATWSVGNLSVAEVSNADGTRGLVTGLGVGTSAVTAAVGGVSGVASVSVSDAVLTQVAVSPAAASLALGLSMGFTATGSYSDGQTRDLTELAGWTSSDPAVAEVASQGGVPGRATALAEGSTTLTAAVGAAAGNATLTVTPPRLVAIVVSPPAPSVAKGRPLQLSAEGQYSDGSTRVLTAVVDWSSSDLAVAHVSDSFLTEGLVTTFGTGTATLTATLGAVSGATALTVTAPELVGLAIAPAFPTVVQGATAQLSALGTYTDGSTRDLSAASAWTSLSPPVATVDAGGLARGLAVGTAQLRAEAGGFTAEVELSVTSAQVVSIAVTFPGALSIPKGRTGAFVATGTLSDGTTQDVTALASWSSSAESIAPVSNAAGTRGVVAGAQVGQATITATLGQASGNKVAIITEPELVSIVASPASATLAVGQTQLFRAIGTLTDGTVADVSDRCMWTSSAPAVADISNDEGSVGLLTAYSAGTAGLLAQCEQAFSGATVTVTP